MGADATPLQLGERVPGQAVLEELMALQRRVPPRNLLQRVFGASPLRPETITWYKGALGEIAVGQILEGLGPEWLVLHAVPVGTGSADIDHVLVGPAGVFTLNTKNHSGQPVWVAGRALLVAGKRTRHLLCSAHEAARAAKLLSAAAGFPVEVTGVVVIVNPKKLTIKTRAERVAVVKETRLLDWLRQLQPVLGTEQVAQIAQAAVQPGTWCRQPPATTDLPALQRSFTALRLLVDQARRRQAAWALSVPAVGVVMLANSAQWGAAILQGLGGP
jgi:hypothetical protein